MQKKKLRTVFTFLGVIGIVCFLIYVLFGIYGIIAGHSIQNNITSCLLPASFLMGLISRKHQNVLICLIFLFFFLAIFQIFVVHSILEKYRDKGMALYNDGEYEEAIINFKKASEIHTGYLRFFNISERNQSKALLWLARSYIKTGRMEEANRMYITAIKFYPVQRYPSSFEVSKEDTQNPEKPLLYL